MSENSRPTKRQRELLTFLDGFIKGYGYGPSYREIMRALNYRSVSTVAIHIDNLITKGYVVKRDHTARSLEVVASDAVFRSTPAASKSEQKWLVDAVKAKFAEIEERGLTQRSLDELYVLVGALQILGLTDAARSLKPKLRQLKQQIDGA